jgi:integrase
MATTKLYLDTRATKRGEPAPLKVKITKHGQGAFIPLDLRIFPSQWDAEHGRVKDSPNKVALNSYIQNQKQKIDNLLLQLTAEGKLAKMSALQIKNLIVDMLNPKEEDGSLFLVRFKGYMETRNKERTRDLYLQTYKRITQFDPKAGQLSFEQISKDWLTRFDRFLTEYEPSQNSRSIHFRNIRAVFNDAIDNDVTACYPFRKFMVRPVATAKRAYSVERLRELFNYPVLPHEQKYVDVFKLVFFLIGINVVDLCNLTEVADGRIVYQRSKTSRLYNIKVEPEAQEIIDRYRGTRKLLNIADNFKDAHTFTSTVNRALKQIGTREHVVKDGRKRLVYHSAFPGLPTYVARHTWATIAYELEIPNETIAAALGHSFGNRTTAIYIDNDIRKVDEANRKVIDYVLGL